MAKNLTIRPFARLLTMLGDQLIKNEQIAVIELIKNAYDADADWVKVSFEGFTESLNITPESRIIIEDNGCGMTAERIEKSWMSPATPNKFSKDGSERRTPKYNRIIQGEKGIGRYAMLKLGKTVNLTTRPANWLLNSKGESESSKEYTLCFDLNSYDSDFINGAKEGNEGLYLDELNFKLEVQAPDVFVEHYVAINNLKFDKYDNSHGTRIEISNLSGSWSLAKLKPIKDSFLRFGDLFNEVINPNEKQNNFTIGLYLNNNPWVQEKKSNDITLRNLIETQSVLQITNGHYASKSGLFTYKQNGYAKSVSVKENILRGMSVFRNHFQDKRTKRFREVADFGDFEFDFYVFDLNSKDESSKYYLPKEAKSIIKEHRIYLLRDNIRVLPYGDPDDDWLQIEVRRGTVRAGDFLSNDQIVGRIKITKFGNPHLKDKTNREGLIEEGNYTTDFICIIQSFLSYIRNGAYAAYLTDKEKKSQLDKIRKDAVSKEISNLRNQLKDDKHALALLTQLENAYKSENKYLSCRVERTESLAAVGISVETASHDIMMMLNKGIDELRSLYEDSLHSNFDYSQLTSELQKLYGIFSYIQNQMKDLQMLFTSSKQRRRQIRVKDILDKVITIYKRTLVEHKIEYKVDIVGAPLVAKCTDADLLQLLINLLDNAIYWLEEKNDKTIIITLDGNNCKLVFSDNGPGIRNEDKPYVFDAFYSGKGQEGRGLGLYISRKLMERNDYSIELAELQEDKILNGANFVVDFIKQERNEY